MRILLFCEVTLVKYNVSTILSPIAALNEQKTTGNSCNDQRSAKTWIRQPQHGQCLANPTASYSEHYYNRGAKQLQPLKVGDQEQIQTRNGPKPGSLLPGPTQVVLVREEKTGAIGDSLLIDPENMSATTRFTQCYGTAWSWKNKASGR